MLQLMLPTVTSSKECMFAASIILFELFIRKRYKYQNILTNKHNDAVNCIIRAKKCRENVIITGSDDQTIIVWNNELEKVRVFHGHNRGVTCLVLSTDEEILISGSADCSLKLWDMVDTKGEIRSFMLKSIPLALSRSNDILAVGLEDGSILFWNISTYEWLNNIPHATILPSNTLITTNPSFYIWDSNNKKMITSNEYINQSSFSYHQRKAFVLTHDRSGLCIAAAGGGDTYHDSKNNYINIYEVTTGKYITSLVGHTGAVRSIAYSHNNQRIVSGGCDRAIKVWNTTNYQLLFTVPLSSSEWILSVSFSPDDRSIISGAGNRCANDDPIKIYDSNNGEITQTLLGHWYGVTQVIYGSNQDQIISCDCKGSIYLWY
jgi:WD40 repeat protein